MTGADIERLLANALDELGYAAMRAPASGGGTTRAMPDVLASRSDERPLAIELKSTHSRNAYVRDTEDVALQRFCEDFGADPILGFLFKSAGGQRRRIWLCDADECRLTDSGHRALTQEHAPTTARMLVLPDTRHKPPEVRDL
jgi:Holliday junction resolvase - archaeal type